MNIAKSFLKSVQVINYLWACLSDCFLWLLSQKPDSRHAATVREQHNCRSSYVSSSTDWGNYALMQWAQVFSKMPVPKTWQKNLRGASIPHSGACIMLIWFFFFWPCMCTILSIGIRTRKKTWLLWLLGLHRACVSGSWSKLYLSAYPTTLIKPGTCWRVWRYMIWKCFHSLVFKKNYRKNTTVNHELWVS